MRVEVLVKFPDPIVVVFCSINNIFFCIFSQHVYMEVGLVLVNSKSERKASMSGGLQYFPHVWLRSLKPSRILSFNISWIHESFFKQLRFILPKNSKFWWISRFSSVFTKARSSKIFSSHPHIYFRETNRKLFPPKKQFQQRHKFAAPNCLRCENQKQLLRHLQFRSIICLLVAQDLWCVGQPAMLPGNVHRADRIMPISQMQFFVGVSVVYTVTATASFYWILQKWYCNTNIVRRHNCFYYTR